MEVAGLVLGALPLVISALEHYSDGLDSVGKYIHYYSTLKALRTRLRIQHVLYQGTLQRLLLSELSPTEAQALFPDPKEPLKVALWKTEAVEKKLRDKLNTEYETFIDVVQVMDGIMKKLMEKLDIDMQGKPKWAATAGSDTGLTQAQQQQPIRIEWEWRRIKRTIAKRKTEELVQEFERYNRDIAAFVDNNEVIAPPTEGRAKSFTAYFNLVRNHAFGLYNILEHGWKCSCVKPHNANLRLDHPKVTSESPSFHVSFSFPQNQNGDQALETWRWTNISIVNVKEQKDQSSSQSTLAAPDSRPDSLAPSARSSLQLRKKLRFGFGSSSDIFPESTNLTPENPRADKTVESLPPIIECLCKAIRNASGGPRYLGSLQDTSYKQIANIETITMASIPTTTLALDLLLSSKQRNVLPSTKLSKQQRISIALTLASAVLQFYESPWLDEMWGKRDVIFFYNGVDEDRRPSISDPYVSRSFQPAVVNPSTNQSLNASVDDFHKSQIINKPLFALGIVLIELCLNKCFEELRAAANLQLGSQSTIIEDYHVAIRQIDAVYDKGGTEYGYVVQRCLKCEFGVQDSKKRLDLDTFRSLVYEGVVAPLEENYMKYSLYRGVTV